MLWSTFMQVLNDVFDVAIPIKLSLSRTHCHPKTVQWLLIRKRMLYCRWCSSGAEADRLVYRMCSSDCSAMVQSVRLQHEQDVLSSGSKSRFFAYVQQRQSAKSGVALLTTAEGSIAVSDDDKAAALQSLFSSVFTTDNGHLPQFADRTSGARIEHFSISCEDVCKVLCKTPLKYVWSYSRWYPLYSAASVVF